jgi:fibro-slime domain-containing protein
MGLFFLKFSIFSLLIARNQVDLSFFSYQGFMMLRIPGKKVLYLGLILLILGISSLWAQTDTNALNGKIVHLYNPYSGIAPSVDVSATAYPMLDEGGNWYKLTLGGLPTWTTGFAFRNAPNWNGWGRLGYTKDQQNGNFTITDFKGGQEIWIITDPHGPDSAAPVILTAPPRLVHILNPWPLNGPQIVTNGISGSMKITPNHCNWYTRFILTEGPLLAYFRNTADNTQTFGKGGPGDNTPFDLAAELTKAGHEIWIDSETGAIASVFPGKEGTCTYLMASTVHDKAEAYSEFYGASSPGGGLTKGMVLPALGVDKTPLWGGADYYKAEFQNWFHSDSTLAKPKKGYETCVDLEMGKSDDGYWEFNSTNTPARGFFPIDDVNRLDANLKGACPDTATEHNFGFCMESHATFKYQKGQVFEFTGDDDVWVYIDNKLGLDLGGRHVAEKGAIKLDTLNLTPGKPYNWDFFFCERAHCASNLRIKTSIYFDQLRALGVRPPKSGPNGSTIYEVFKRIGGTGACGSSFDSVVQEIPPTKLVYGLYTDAGVFLQDLPDNYTSLGGITIATPAISVDVTKVIGLPGGKYRIIFHEPASPKLTQEVKFTLPARNTVELIPATVDTLLGAIIPIIAVNSTGLTPVAEVGKYFLVIPPGLQVFQDKAKTQAVTNGMALTTEATGFDTLWVTGDPVATENQTFKLNTQGSVKTVTITFKLPVLVLPTVIRAAVFDDNGDGIGDRIAAWYDSSITANLPKQITYQWPDKGGVVTLSQGDLTGKIDLTSGGKSLTLSGLKLSDAPSTSGAGTFSSTYLDRKKDRTQVVAILDSMAPVVTKAELRMGASGDTLYLTLSESIVAGSIQKSVNDLFVFKSDSIATPQTMPPQSFKWDLGNTVAVLTYGPGSALVPSPGYLVSVAPGTGGIVDVAGNGTANSHFRVITGVKVSELVTLTFKKATWNEAMTKGLGITPVWADRKESIDSVSKRTGGMGHLIKTDLADYALSDDFIKVSPSDIHLVYDVAYFTKQGGSVNSAKGEVGCLDPIFLNDCTKHRGYVFLNWNLTSHDGARVGTGAYVARIRYQILVSGKKVAENSRQEIWGLLRNN